MAPDVFAKRRGGGEVYLADPYTDERQGVPGVIPPMRTAEYWVARDRAREGPQDRAVAASLVRSGLLDLDQVASLPEPTTVPQEPPPGFRADGRPWDADAWQGLVRRLQRTRVIPGDLGVTVGRVSLRTWPTEEPAFRDPHDREFDRWQVTRVHTCDPVRILAATDDGWLFAASSIAAGWMPAAGVARAAPEIWESLRRPVDPVVIVGAGVVTEAEPYHPEVAHRSLEFGAWLPPSGESNVGGQHRMGHIGVLCPVRQRDGWLELRPALIKDDGRARQGFLACERASLLRTAFSQLGDRYDWGDRLGHHDCSSLVMDAYRTMGVQIPRNSRVQSLFLPHRIRWTPADDIRRRLGELEEARPGDLLHMPGHVLMHLGSVDGVPYALHAFVGYGMEQDGETAPVLVNAVEVSPLTLRTRRGPRFVEVLTGVSNIL